MRQLIAKLLFLFIFFIPVMALAQTAGISGVNSGQTANAFGALQQTTKRVTEAGNRFIHSFVGDLFHGVRGSEVAALQYALVLEGFYGGEATGNFYDRTYDAVRKFQRKYGLKMTGYVGPATRAKLNELYGR